VLGALAAVYIVHGSIGDLRIALLLLWMTSAVDATDGWLARRFRVAEAVPSIDGSRLDDIVDFQTFVSLPLLLVWRADLLPGDFAWILLLPLLASAYGFSQVQAKTSDGFFRGFPSYWNVVAFYLFFLQPALPVTLLLLTGFTVLTIVPLRYLYPTKGGPFGSWIVGFGVVWALLLLLILLEIPEREMLWVLVSLMYPAFYLGASWSLAFRTAPD